jgi:hypothetical protein
MARKGEDRRGLLESLDESDEDLLPTAPKPKGKGAARRDDPKISQ